MKILKLITAALLAAALLTGCSGGNSGSSAGGADSAAPANSSAADTDSAASDNNSPADAESAAPGGNGGSAIPTNDSGKMRPDMTSAQFVEEMGIGLNLGNTLDAYWEDKENKTSGAQTIKSDTPADYEACWGSKPITRAMVDGIAAEGFSTVRIPVYWGNMMKDDGTYTISETYLDRVEEVLNYCLDNGLYAVINDHHYDAFLIKNFPREKVLEINKSLWTQIAQRFNRYSDFLIFESFNESLGESYPDDKLNDDEKYEYVNALNQSFVDAVRATGGNNAGRMLIVSGYWTNIDRTTDARFKVPSDAVQDRIMVSVHYVDNAMYWTNKIGGKEWQDYSKAQCELLKNAFTDKGIQVFVGECTGIYEAERFVQNAEYKTSSECFRFIMDMIEEYGFAPVIWDVGKDFYSRITCSLGSETDRAVIQDFGRSAAAA